MSSPHRARTPLAAEECREHGLKIAMRLIAIVRMGRSYAIGNPVFTGQLEQLLEVLAPVLAAGGEARLYETDDELTLNGTVLPMRSANARFTEQLAQELRVRAIAGVRFTTGLQLGELEMFMRHFLPSEIYKGADLERACVAQDIRHVQPLLPGAAATTTGPVPASGETPPGYARALETWALVGHDARALLAAGPLRAVATHHYRRIVQPLVDGALAGDPVTAGLADLDVARQGDWQHGLRTALLAIATGRALGLGRTALADVGVAALLHGVHAPLHPAPGNPDRRLRVLIGLAETAPLDPPVLAAMRVALDTHAEGAIAGTCSALIGIADAYVSLASSRPGGAPRWTAQESLGLVLGPLAGRFPAALRAALVRALGLYPPGQVVELDDGSVARVCAAEPSEPARPIIELLAGPAGTRVADPGRGAVGALPAARHVRRAVPFARGEQSPTERAA